MFLRLHLPHISCKELQLKKKTREDIIKSKLKKKDRNGTEFSRLFWFFPREDKLAFASISFCTRCCLIIFLAGNSKGRFVKIFAEIVARGNSVQIGPNFPAKSLNIYIYEKNFLIPFLIGLIEITYLIKENVKEIYSLLKVKLLWLIEWETTKK